MLYLCFFERNPPSTPLANKTPTCFSTCSLRFFLVPRFLSFPPSRRDDPGNEVAFAFSPVETFLLYFLRLFCRYSFDPRDLLVKILTVLVRMANASEDREFVKCLAANPDYSRLSIEKALCVVQRENLAADHVVQDLRKVMQEVFYSCNSYVSFPCNVLEIEVFLYRLSQGVYF